MNFEAQVRVVNQTVMQLRERGQLDPRLLAMAVEINQRYIELLDEAEHHLSDGDHSVTVQIDGGQRVRFKNPDDFAGWLAEVES